MSSVVCAILMGAYVGIHFRMTAQAPAAHQHPGSLFLWALCGLLCSFGISVGGMADRSGMNFFTLSLTLVNPSLLVVFCCALIAPMIYWNVWPRPKPDASFCATAGPFDFWLFGGSALFGLGWAIGGLCPGPSVAAMISGKATYVIFSYGLYFAMVVSHLWRHRHGLAELPASGVALTAALGMVPLMFYVFPYLRVWTPPSTPSSDVWPLGWSAVGGLIMGIAVVATAYLLSGATLGLSTLWRHILNPSKGAGHRTPLVAFFVGFVVGAFLASYVHPAVFAHPPVRSPLAAFVGCAFVALGTDWANGCTSGHGLCGLSRFRLRSFAATPVFMAGVFVFLPLLLPYMSPVGGGQ